MDHNRKVVEIPLDDILPNRFQPRIKFNEDSIIELSESIKEHGVIQPIVVRPVGDKFEIIAGERRYKASCMAGLEKIPALITDLNDKDSAEVALIENVQRKDLTPIEEAISYKKILDMGYLTQEKLAEKLGKKQSTVANKLRLLNLDEEVQEAILEDKISERHARSILKLTNPEDQRKILNKIIQERLTVRKTDEEINKMLNGNYEDVSKILPKEPIIEEKKEEPVSEMPFDFSKLDFLQTNNEESENSSISNEIKAEEPKSFEIPKFEDLLAETENIQSEQAPEAVSFELPKFEDLFAKVENNNAKEVSEPVAFEIPNFEDLLSQPISTNNDQGDNNTNVVFEEPKPSIEESIPENKIVESSPLLNETPTPFVFEDLFLNDYQEELDIVEIPDNIDFIDEQDEDKEKITDNGSNEVNGLDFLTSINSANNSTSRNNTYVANDFKTVINTIRNCAETIEKYGFKIDVEELELSGEYKVTFTIQK